MRKKRLIFLMIAGLMAAAGIGNSVLGAQKPAGAGDPCASTDPAMQDICKAQSDTVSDPGGGSLVMGVDGGSVYKDITDPVTVNGDEKTWGTGDPGKYVDGVLNKNIMLVQKCKPCQVNIYEQMKIGSGDIKDSGDAELASQGLEGAAMKSKSQQISGELPPPQCLEYKKPDACLETEATGGPCTNDCLPRKGDPADHVPNICDGPANDGANDQWDLDQGNCRVYDALAQGCITTSGCNKPEEEEDPYPTHTLKRQPEAWVWTGGCGDGTFGGMVSERYRSVGHSCTGLKDKALEDCNKANSADQASAELAHSDLFPSITGCYNPEERFVKPVGTNEEGGTIMAPDDARLTLHPRCIPGDTALETNQHVPMAAYKTKTAEDCKDLTGAELSKCQAGSNLAMVLNRDDDEGTFKPNNTIGCLKNDYIDDFSNFCRKYIQSDDHYLKDRWVWDGTCWQVEENVQAFQAFVPGEHYLPLAMFEESEDSKTNAFPDGQSYLARYGNMGQNGFGIYRIYDPRMNPQGTLIDDPTLDDPVHAGEGESKGTWVDEGIYDKTMIAGRPYDPLDVYNYGDPAFVMSGYRDITYVGRKFKMQACLKQYIEEYAHLGDCKKGGAGGIVLDGAQNVSESHCQWVTMARQDQNKTMLQNLFSVPPVQQALTTVLGVGLNTIAGTLGELVGGTTADTGDVSKIKITRSRRGMRSEYFDYQNFATAGWVPATPPIGGITPALSTDICTKEVSDGSLQPLPSEQVFNTAKGLDFARRGCPTVVGPDTWPDFFKMQSCDFDRGAKQFAEGVSCINGSVDQVNGGCLEGDDPFSYLMWQTFPPQLNFRNPLLTTDIKSALAIVWWSGFRAGIADTATDIANMDLSVVGTFGAIKPMMLNSVPAGGPFLLPIMPPQDYVDTLWVARSCDHESWLQGKTASTTEPVLDYWYETPDWMPEFFPGQFGGTMSKCVPYRAGYIHHCNAGDHPTVPKDCHHEDLIEDGEDAVQVDEKCDECDRKQDPPGITARDGTCLDPILPTETVLGFPFYGGDLANLNDGMFTEYQWPNVIDVIGDILTEVIPKDAWQSLSDFTNDLMKSSPDWASTVINGAKDGVQAVRDAAKVAEKVNTGLKIAGTVNTFAPMLGLYSQNSFLGESVTWTTENGPMITDTTIDAAKLTYKLEHVYNDMMSPEKVLNAAGLGGLDIGCLGEEWEDMYPGKGDGGKQIMDYVNGQAQKASADLDPNTTMPAYAEGDGNNKKIPAKCIKNDNGANMPVVYSWHPNPMRFQDAQWCEFEVPYLPHVYDADLLHTSTTDLVGDLITKFTVTPGFYDDPTPGVSYVEAAYNAALASVDGVTDIAAVAMDDAARDDVRYKSPTEKYSWYGHLRAIYEPDVKNNDEQYSAEDLPGFPMVERIRDGCGAFTQRASWSHDRETGLAHWLLNKNVGRCEGWKGIYGRKHGEMKIVSWRLPRFNYEFLKAFIECTGPVYSGGPNVCSDGINWLRIALNALPCTAVGATPPCIEAPNVAGVPVIIPGNGRPFNLDDKTKYNEPWNAMGGGKKFGFWCNCPRDNAFTTTCNESFCTCDAINFNDVPYPGSEVPGTRCDGTGCGMIAPASQNMCDGYGPFAQWLQCYYNARAKACPVLEREISNGIPGSMHMQTDPNAMRMIGGSFQPASKLPAERVTPEQICPGTAAKANYENLRWNAEEPNILAHLPITADFAGRDQSQFFNGGKPSTIAHDIGYLKHRDLVFQSAVRDIEAPYMEITLPWPSSLDIPAKGLVDPLPMLNPAIKEDDMALFEKAHDAANLAFMETRLSDLGGLDDFTGVMHSDWPSARATEAIVGPRGCDIGGWYEMMLYQARCIRWFKLNCICDYKKTFVNGSAEAYVLQRAGAGFHTLLAHMDKGRITVSEQDMLWPLMWRGFVGPDYAPPPRYIPNATDVTGSGLDMLGIASKKPVEITKLVADGSIIDTQKITTDEQREQLALWESKNSGKLWIAPLHNDPEATGLSKAYEIGYGGLEDAQAGDFMIYDEEIPARNGSDLPPGEDARYMRHIAYVEYADTDRHQVTVSEWNYGKDLDSCGNTDRWGIVTTRVIHREDENGNLAGMFCNNPDWLDCYEPNWYYIKIYRPSKDVNNPDRPICFSDLDQHYPYEGAPRAYPGETMEASNPTADYALQLPEPFGPDSRSMKVQFDAKGRVVRKDPACTGDLAACPPQEVPTEAAAANLSPAEKLRTGAWKRGDYGGWYDANEVGTFLKIRRGRCDPPVESVTLHPEIPEGLQLQTVDPKLLKDPE